MAHLEIHGVKEQDEVLSLLKHDGKGWNLALFEDQIKITTSLCANCNDVCCDAVELGCDHEDDEIYPHCKDCLNILINNDKSCPINSHLDPVIIPNRSMRRQVSKSIVLCPFSLKYKQLLRRNDAVDNGQIIDTIGGDEKEGIAPQNNNNNHNNNDNDIKAGCVWSGTLDDLIKKHITECAKKNDPSFSKNIAIKRLKEENNKLTEIIGDKQQKIEQQKYIINELQQKIMTLTNKTDTKIISYAEQNIKLKQDLDRANNKINVLQRKLNGVKSSIKTQETKVKEQTMTIKQLINDIHGRNKEISHLKKRRQNDEEKQAKSEVVKMPDDVASAAKNLYSDSPTINWFAAILEDPKLKTAKLKIASAGNGGLLELKKYAAGKDQQIVFMYLRVNTYDDSGSMRAKFIYGILVGSRVKFMKKAKLTSLLGRINEQFLVKHLTVDSDEKMKEWNIERLSKDILRVCGAHKPSKYEYGPNAVYNV